MVRGLYAFAEFERCLLILEEITLTMSPAVLDSVPIWCFYSCRFVPHAVVGFRNFLPYLFVLAAFHTILLTPSITAS